MSTFCAMKQIGARNMGYKIIIMEWSNKMDLIAIGNDKGEVIVYRLNWQKIWTQQPPSENVEVRGISWKPDEKIIAIAYSTGDVVLLDVENKEELYSFTVSDDIVRIGWTQNNKQEISISADNQPDYINNHEIYLPTLSNLNLLSSTPRKSNTKNPVKYKLNLLIICIGSGQVYISVFGMLPCGNIDVAKHLNLPPSSFQIIDAKFSYNFRELQVVIQKDCETQIIVFENDILWKYSEPLLNLAIKYSQITTTFSYINETIQSIIEAWETVLMEMDNKLTKYAESQAEGAVSADFLELLVFGHPSEDLESFLLRDLTEKGIKKLGNSIELSYSTIQKLVIKHLHTAIIHICYHLNVVKGMSQNICYYKPILGELPVDVIRNAGSFLIKANELQQVIDQSTRDYKIFFRWLYIAIIRLMEEPIPDDTDPISQQEINYLAEFLNNFDKGPCAITSNDRRFNMERVGQYLEDKNLIIPIQIDSTLHWHHLLEENQCLADCEFIYPHYKHLSLVQQHKLLRNGINEVFKKPSQIIGNNFRIKQIVKCIDRSERNDEKIFIAHINKEDERIGIFALIESPSMMILTEFDSENKIKSLKLQFQRQTFFENKFSAFGELSFRHIQFYNEHILSVLLDGNINGKHSSYFVQFSISYVRDMAVEATTGVVNTEIVKTSRLINMYDVLDPLWIRPIENFDACFISVSGNRKISSILSENLRRIRFYEMETEEEDEEIDISQNNSLDNSKDSTT